MGRLGLPRHAVARVARRPEMAHCGPAQRYGQAARRTAEEGRAETRVSRAKVEHPFRVVKRKFGLTKIRFRGLVKNTAHVVTLFALSNL